MQKNRNRYLTLSLVLMILGSAGLFFFAGEETKPEIDREYFKVVDSEKIDRVTILSSQGNIELKFSGNRWRVNEKWDADMQMIKVLLATIRQVEPRRPVAAAMVDSVKRWLDQRGTRVSFFENDVMKSGFVAGGNTMKTETWFLKEDDTQPYVVMIPGYRVYVAGILELDESGWRNKRIFDFNWRNFKSLKTTYPKEPKQSFEIEMKDRYFGIAGIDAVDTTKLNDYLDDVSLLFASRFISPGQAGIDSLVAAPPAVLIEIRDIGSRTFTLELFTPRQGDGEIYGRLADGQIVALQKNKIAEIVRRREYFVAGRGR